MSESLLRLWCSAQIRVAGLREDRGATAVEYALMIAFIAAVIIFVVQAVGSKTSNAFESVNSQFP